MSSKRNRVTVIVYSLDDPDVPAITYDLHGMTVWIDVWPHKNDGTDQPVAFQMRGNSERVWTTGPSGNRRELA